MSSVNKLQSLADAAEDHGMLADDVAGSHGKKRNFLPGPFPHDAFGAGDADFVQIAVYRFRHRPPQSKRGSAGSILLETVVGLDNLDIVVLAEQLGGLAQESDQDVHAQARVSRKNGRSATGESFDLRQLLRIESGCGNKQWSRLLRCDCQIPQRGLWIGKVDDDPIRLELRLDLVGYFHTEMSGAGNVAGVLPQSAAARFINRRNEPNTGSLRCGTHDRAAHAATDAANNEAQRHRD